MEKINDGGPAFPIKGGLSDYSFDGISIRDYFAAKAMQGLIAQAGGVALESSLRIGAEYAYAMADEMLKAREVQS